MLLLLFLLAKTVFWVLDFEGFVRVLVVVKVGIWGIRLEKLRSNGLEKWV